MYEQVVLPTYNIPYTGGKCEKYVENTTGQTGVWGAAVLPVPPYSYTGAWQENYNDWNHPGEQPPWGFRVPVFFSLGDNPEGHTGIWIGDGRIATTPKAGDHPTAYIYPSMQAMIDDYAKYNGGCIYLGWSEGIGKKQVVKEKDMGMSQDQVKLVILLGEHREATPEDVQAWTGDDINKLMNQITVSPLWLKQNDILLVQYPKLENGAIPLTSGIYKVG